MNKPVMIIGAGRLALAAIEIFEKNEVIVFGVLDDNKELLNSELGSIPVLGSTTDDNFLTLIGKKCEVFIALDELAVRKKLVTIFTDDNKTMPVNAIHSDSSISMHAEIGHGNFIDHGALIGAASVLGNHCLLLAGSSIGHKCLVGDFVQVGQGANIGDEVQIEDDVFIGSGAVIVSGIKLSKGARIGAGSVVIENVGKGKTVFGNPAKIIVT